MNYQDLKAEFIEAFMTGPTELVHTPEFADQAGGTPFLPVSAVVEDDFAASDGSICALLRIMADLVSSRRGLDVLQREALAWLIEMADRHATYHAPNEAQRRLDDWKAREAQADAGVLLARMRSGLIQPVTASKLGDLS